MKALDNAKAIYDLTMNERCEEKVQVLFSNGLHKLMIDLIEELEELENRSCSNCNNFQIFNSKVVRDSCCILNVSDIGGCGDYFEPKKG